jgi:putative ABC transport system permease protein
MIMPYTTVMKKLSGISWLQSITVSANTSADMDAAQTQIAALLRQRHHLRASEADDFIIRSPTDIAQARAQTLGVMELLLACIASVSLIVGGIGIMNIMLVSVRERTREIGLRQAVGAKTSDILAQFLVEATTLSICGGIAGVIVGITSSIIISHVAGWQTVVSPGAIILAVAFSAVVGIGFGFYPARKAAYLDPIEALRFE